MMTERAYGGGTAVVSFRDILGKYANNGHKRLMKPLLVFAAAVGLLATVIASKAALGWTLNASVQHYGGSVEGAVTDADGIGRIFYLFKHKSCAVGAFYLNGTNSRVVWTKTTF